MKERLTGAIILVVLIVLLVPELLSGPKGPAATPPPAGAASASSEEPPLQSYTIHLGDDSHSQSETANGTAGSSGPPQPQPAQPTTQAATPEKDLSESSSWDSSATTDAQAANPNSTPANPAKPSTSAATAQKPSQEAETRTEHSRGNQPAPNVAAHAELPKPSAPAAAPRANQPAPNVVARTEPSKPSAVPRSNQTTRTAAAEKAAAKPHPAAPATEAGAWGVQLGVFASKDNAERLALDVRTKGFKASVSPVTSGKRKLYRVRVGPAADKAAAQDLQSKLKAAGRPGGTVVPYS